MATLTSSMFEILAVLAGGPLHGYAIAKRIVELHDYPVRAMGPATLYSSIQRLEEMGLLQELAALPDDSRRKTYQLTSSGAKVLSEEVSQRRSFLDNATSFLPGNPASEGAR